MTNNSKNNLLKNFKDLYTNSNEKFDQLFKDKKFQVIDPKIMKEAILKSAKTIEKDFSVGNKIKGKNTLKILEQKNNSDLSR